jgi:hypothetical protein
MKWNILSTSELRILEEFEMTCGLSRNDFGLSNEA